MADYDAFISYARKDKDFGLKIYEALSEQSCVLWMDWKNIAFTASFWEEITKGIVLSNNFVFLISLNSLTSPICQLELNYALEQNKRIVPIVIQDTDPDEASRLLIDKSLTDYQRVLLAGRDIVIIARRNWAAFQPSNWMNFIDISKFDENIKNLVETLDSDNEYKSEHTFLVNRALHWKAQQLPERLLRGQDLGQAETWLTNADKIPLPTDLQREFLLESRRIENEDRTRLDNLNQTIFKMKQAAQALQKVRNGLIITVVVAVVVILAAIALLSEAQFRQTITTALNQRARGSNSYLIKDFDNARTLYSQALETLNPRHEKEWNVFTDEKYRQEGLNIADILNNLGEACAQLRKFECAIDAFESATALDHFDAGVFLNLANVYREDDKPAEAQSILDNIPDDRYEQLNAIDIARIEAAIAYDMKQFDKALEILDEWRDFLKDNITYGNSGYNSASYLEMVYYTALVYEARNDADHACKFWQDYHETWLQFPPEISLFWESAKQATASSSLSKCI